MICQSNLRRQLGSDWVNIIMGSVLSRGIEVICVAQGWVCLVKAVSNERYVAAKLGGRGVV